MQELRDHVAIELGNSYVFHSQNITQRKFVLADLEISLMTKRLKLSSRNDTLCMDLSLGQSFPNRLPWCWHRLFFLNVFLLGR